MPTIARVHTNFLIALAVRSHRQPACSRITPPTNLHRLSSLFLSLKPNSRILQVK
ncbi:hypothetical protein B0H12DRAFT_1089629 [Mycena haematopus]|nr:hypothetical protein B0H12DRAFT_1089629 [Mycena haematopus]